MRFPNLWIRRPAALAVTVLALDSAVWGVAAPSARARALPGAVVSPLPGGPHVAALLLGLVLLALTPRLWRGTRTAVALAIVALVALAALSFIHGRYEIGTLQGGMALLLTLAHRSFRMGCSNRPHAGILMAALAAWSLAAGALALAPLVRHAGRVLALLHHPAGHHPLHAATRAASQSGNWNSLIEVLVGGAVLISVLALRSLVSPARAADGNGEHDFRAARAIVDAHGTDSLAPFVVRPDKALAFAAGGVVSYRVIGGTAVVSADPVAPGDAAGEVLAGFQEQARRRGWRIALWGASARHLDAYRRLGLRALRVGEEAYVDPREFTLEGRAVRKLRQSVHRVSRRGWHVIVRDGRDIDATLESEIEQLTARWRVDHPKLHGFAMGMGQYEGELRADDLYVLARSPEGELGAVMRFVTYGPNLSLDAMQRVGETPNGLNEALVVRALEVARERQIPEVSLNYAGLAHLVRDAEPSRSRLRRALTSLALGPLHRRFQMDRLVRFNEKFSPEWRPRYLVYESRLALPLSIVRVLQAEGYLPHWDRSPLLPRLAPRLPGLLPARTRHRRALSEPR